MIRRCLPVLLSGAALALGACGDDDKSASTASSTASTASTASTSTASASSAAAGTSGANTAAVAAKADAFLATLTDTQKKKVQREAGSQDVKASWSNFPSSIYPRIGVYLGELSGKQLAAALDMMKTALSEQGYAQLEALRAADTYLGSQEGSGGGGGGAPSGGTPPSGSAPSGGAPGGSSTSLDGASKGGDKDYDGGNYFITIWGTPSKTDKWLLQYTGHHFTTNIAYQGDRVSFGPEFSGVEPIEYTAGGKTVEPLKDQGDAFKTIIANLGDQASDAKLSSSFDDLLLGAQKDTGFPSKPEGATVSDLPAKAQAAVKDAIKAYVGDLPKAAADAKMKEYEDAFDETSFAYAGIADDRTQGFYARLDGPKLWIEISTQNAIVVSGTHYHSVYREQGSDYGGQ